jgi:hypothetical protein
MSHDTLLAQADAGAISRVRPAGARGVGECMQYAHIVQNACE